MTSSADQAMRSIHRMLNPASIAVVGATARLQYGGRFLQGALRASEKVKVYPVNPRYQELMGVKCYPSLRELPDSPDLVGIIVPYDRVMSILEECVEVGAGSAIVISAGFAERGTQEGGQLQGKIGELARRSGMRVCGPNCLGVANLKANVWASAAPSGAEGISGSVALVSQSGASAFGPFLSGAVDRGIGYSYIVSTGNEADLGSADFVRYLLDDADTKAIACFVEGFKDGRQFQEVARMALERGKPIVLIKVGRSDLGARAARSHTAALTGSDEVQDAVFKQFGVVRVEGYDELLEVSQLLAYSPAPEAEGVSVVSHSGGIGSLTADKCGQMGLHLPELREGTREALSDVLQGFGWAANPADVTGLASSQSFPRIMELMINEPEVGALVVASGLGDDQARQVIELRKRTRKAIAFLWTGSQSATEGLDLLKESNIPLFYQPEGLARGLRGLLEFHHRQRVYLKNGLPQAEAMSKEQKEELGVMSSLGRQALTEYEAKRLISRWGIPAVVERRATSRDEAADAAEKIGYPIVLKVESPDILHKTDDGLVCLNICSEQELDQAYEDLMGSVHSRHPAAEVLGVLVQEMVRGGTEVIVGVSRDPQFGPVLMFGMGGVFVEVYRDVAFRVCPITRQDALEMVEEVKGAKVLKGYRGGPPADLDALVDVLLRASSLAVNLGDALTELDINPLAVLPQGQGVKALDALVVFGWMTTAPS